MTDPKTIADGLSEKMHSMLLQARQEEFHQPDRCRGPANTRQALRERGLAHGDFCHLTPLGLAVREILKGEDRG